MRVYILVSHLRVLSLEPQVRDNGGVGPKVLRNEDRDVAHILHLGNLRRIVHLPTDAIEGSDLFMSLINKYSKFYNVCVMEKGESTTFECNT